jgi:hypothetical protein
MNLCISQVDISGGGGRGSVKSYPYTQPNYIVSIRLKLNHMFIETPWGGGTNSMGILTKS